ncbi:MAG TPA: hypothetical protein VMT51_05675 [Dongiaceae bacterium]|nr:hypothetical protein [Dongiaceae bacterium]
MLSRSSALRLHVESALAGRVLSPFRFQQPQPITASCGIPELDQLSGGLPRGALTEIYGAACSGITSLLQSALAARTASGECCALVDAQDAFAPAHAQSAGVALRRLLWVRCRNLEQALRSVDLLLHGGGFSLVAVNLTAAPSRLVRHVPLNFWFRLRRTVENTSTILLLLTRESHAKTCASLVLHMERAAASWSWQEAAYPSRAFHTPAALLHSCASTAEIVRSPSQRKNIAFIDQASRHSDRTRFALSAQDFFPAASAGGPHLPPSHQERTENRG